MKIINSADIEGYFMILPDEVYISPMEGTIYFEWNYKKKRLIMTVYDSVIYFQEFYTDKYILKSVSVGHIDEINQRVMNQILYNFYEGRSIT